MRKMCAMTTPLQAFLTEKGITLTAFAASIGRPVSTVHGWACGRRKPQWSDIPAIEQATGGVVTARDFVPQQAA